MVMGGLIKSLNPGTGYQVGSFFRSGWVDEWYHNSTLHPLVMSLRLGDDDYLLDPSIHCDQICRNFST